MRWTIWVRVCARAPCSSSGFTNCSAIAGKEAEVDKRDGDGRTALHWAAAGGKDDVVEFLLSREASVNTHDDVCLLCCILCTPHAEPSRCGCPGPLDAFDVCYKRWPH